MSRRAIPAAFLFLFSIAAHAAVPQSERDALMVFFNATGGPQWTQKTGWGGAVGSECEWYGIGCNDAGTSVTSIGLAANNLSGTIPASIRDLRSLKRFVVYDNKLSGPFPAGLTEIVSLEEISLYFNQFSGPLPPEIGRLVNLVDLDITDNRFSGELPREIGSLTRLRTLFAFGNDFSGAIPKEIGRLASLQILFLGRNRLSGGIPAEIALLTKLEILHLAENPLGGAIPPDLARMTALTEAFLAKTGLSGEIPAGLGQIQSLELLDLGENELRGRIPPALGGLPNLRNLTLAVNKLEGEIPLELTRLRTLTVLDLSYNQFTGVIPSDLSRLERLEVLYLQANQFSGELPLTLTTFPSLMRLDVSSNKLEGRIPPELSRLKTLLSLNLGDNALTGPIPPGLGELTALEDLSLFSNKLSGPIPRELGALRNLNQLLLMVNELTGTIPNELSALVKLTALGLSYNRLTGGIPAWIGDLRDLEGIDLSFNDLGGAIPDSFTNLTNLTYLNLASNGLTGSIPRDIGNLTKLEYLYLYDNSLSGSIPSSFSGLQNLADTSLGFNQLSGTLPSLEGFTKLESFDVCGNSLTLPLPPSLFNVQSLKSLWLCGNRFAGPFPVAMTQLKNLESFDIGENAFRGEVPREVLTMTKLLDASSYIYANALFTTDESVRAFLKLKMGEDWEEWQTVMPRNVTVSDVTDRSVAVSWTPIAYDWDEGGYEVTVTPAGGGQPVIATTPWKDVDTIIVRGLAAATSYSVSVRTITFPDGYLQRNLVASDATAPVPFSTGPRVVSPPIVVITTFPEGLVQVAGITVNRDSYSVTNYGDTSTTITLTKNGEFFQHAPASFTLAAGATQVVTLTIPQALPPGTYEGYSFIEGNGVEDEDYAVVRALSVLRPTGTAIAEPAQSRVEIAGERGTDSVGTVTYKNSGTATLTGILIPDVPWITAPRDPIVIEPGSFVPINFTVVRSKRPDDGGVAGALTGNLNLLYVDGSPLSGSVALGDGPSQTTTTGVSVSTVTVVDTSKPPVSNTSLPAIPSGEVARYIAGISSLTSSTVRNVADLVVTNSFGSTRVSDLRLYFAPPAATSASVATFSAVDPSRGVALANVVGNVYGSSSVGTVHVRSQRWSSLETTARALALRPNGTVGGAVPIFRSDRAIARTGSLALVGLPPESEAQTTIFVQETSGSSANVRIDFHDARGRAVGTPQRLTIASFALTEVRTIPPGSVTAVVTNEENSSGRIVAYARMTDAVSGDIWTITDWNVYYEIAQKDPEAVRVPLVQSLTASSGGGRRRAANHAITSIATDVAIFNRGTKTAEATLQFYDSSGGLTERQLQIEPRETLLLRNVLSTSFGRGNATGSLVLVPGRNAFLAMTARSYTNERTGSEIPVVGAGAGLRRGQFDVFSGIEESTSAAATLSLPGTSRTRFGFVETSGGRARIRASVVVSEGSALVSTIIARDYSLGPRELLYIDNLSTSIFGPNRDEKFGALHNLQLRFEVIDGDGSVTSFVSSVDNQSRDEIFRLE